MKTPPVEFVALQGCQTLPSSWGYSISDISILRTVYISTY